MADSSFLDWPFFDDAHRQLAAQLRQWSAQHIAPLGHPASDTDSIDSHCRRLVRMLGAAGWLRYCVPGNDGGNGRLDVRSLCLCREILAYVSGLADFAFAMQGLGTGSITLFGGEELKQRYLPKAASGENIAAFALSEPDAGSDVAALKTSAARNGADYVLNGVKTWISNAGLAAHYVVFARTGEGPGARGLSAFVVDADTPGLEVVERIPVSAPHPLGTLRFDGCRVPADSMLGSPGDGYRVAMATLEIFRSTVGAAALGFARRAMDEAVAHSRARAAFGKTLAEFQLIQAKLADMAVFIDASALLIYRAGWAKDATPERRVNREASMAKLYATEAAQRVIDEAVQIFGGLGVVSGNVAEELYREIRALRIYEGTSEIQKLVIANTIIKEASDGA